MAERSRGGKAPPASAAAAALDVGAALARLDRATPRRETGRVTEVTGVVLRATVPGLRVGELVLIEPQAAASTATAATSSPASPSQPLQAEVVGFRGDEAVLLPLGELTGIGPDAVVTPTGRALAVGVSARLPGRVLDGLGRPVDGAGPVPGAIPWPVDRPAPDPLSRRRVSRPLPLGVRALDGLCTVGEGQRIGLFAGSGVGKSTLMGQIARQADADVNVIALVGERGREVADFLDESLGEAGRARSVVVAATSDAPALVRLRAAFVATAIAEWFRAEGKRVLFMLDSLTRVARAQREVGLAAGEPPVRQGYPPSVFGLLPRLVERTGTDARGSITALYTVLVAGGDMEEPIADEVRGILDGHVVLSRALAERGRWPAVDVLPSLSRLMERVADGEHRAAAARVRALLAAYERHRDLILLGAYEPGRDRDTDDAVARMGAIEDFLRQATGEAAPFEETRRRLLALGS